MGRSSFAFPSVRFLKVLCDLKQRSLRRNEQTDMNRPIRAVCASDCSSPLTVHSPVRVTAELGKGQVTERAYHVSLTGDDQVSHQGQGTVWKKRFTMDSFCFALNVVRIILRPAPPQIYYYIPLSTIF